PANIDLRRGITGLSGKTSPNRRLGRVRPIGKHFDRDISQAFITFPVVDAIGEMEPGLRDRLDLSCPTYPVRFFIHSLSQSRSGYQPTVFEIISPTALFPGKRSVFSRLSVGVVYSQSIPTES